MIQQIRERFFALRYGYDEPALRQRASVLLVLAIISFLTWLGSIILLVIPDALEGRISPPILLIIIAVPFILLTIYQLIQTGRATTAIWIAVIISLFPSVPIAALDASIFNGFWLLLPVVVSGVLLPRREFIVVLALVALAFLVRIGVMSQNDIVTRFVPSINGIQELGLVAFLLVQSAFFLYGFSGSTERVNNEAFQDIRHLQTFARFDPELSDFDQDRLALQSLRLIQELGYATAQIYFGDEVGNISRRIRADGTIDTRFNTRLEAVPGVGLAVTGKAPRVIQRSSDQLSDYPVAPARVGLVIPILFAGNVLMGVLDVQSRRADPPSPTQLDAFVSLANQLARALMNARRVSDLRRTIQGQEDVIATFRTRLSELQQRSTNVVSGGWSRYLSGRGEQAALGYNLSLLDGKPTAISANDLPPEIRSTIAHGDIHVQVSGDTQTVLVPILLRDEVLGAMTFTLPSDPVLTDRQIEALRAVATRLGQALENNRLLEQSQAQAQRERKVNEVGARLIGATSVESLLEIAAENFNEALGAVYTRIHITPMDFSGRNVSHNGSANGHGSSSDETT